MSQYRFYRDGLKFTVTRDRRPYCHGKVVLSLSTYNFTFADEEDNEYSMVASGLFFWRSIKLYINGTFQENYTLSESKTSQIRLDSRMFVRIRGEYVHHIDKSREHDEHGKCLYSWQGTPRSIEREVICLVVLRFISGMQSSYSSATAGI
ncbi:hypothetical protein QPM17_17060 [Marinobacter sp. TBZ242]|uniref:Uncharacterized protein n=1 Tax=Marinobacter azerbaijanicus TaxID=3050455 RepID=A0ABT7IFA8_9GAMM|nr:hypothetical protein [Marinobacter sp. TBZ242]MDL0432856.1 hypothetical protein [Marinobacter sp. TBZ242]